MCIGMPVHAERASRTEIDAELFANLPPDTILQTFARFNFSAGKFPKPAEEAVFRAARQEKSSVLEWE